MHLAPSISSHSISIHATIFQFPKDAFSLMIGFEIPFLDSYVLSYLMLLIGLWLIPTLLLWKRWFEAGNMNSISTHRVLNPA